MRVNNLYVWSNAEIGSNLEVKGAMAVTGSVTHSGNLTIGGNLAVTGTSEFSDAVNFTGANVQFGTGVYLKATGGKLYAGSTGGGSDLDFVAGTLTLTKDFTQNNDLRGGIAISRGVSGGNGANGIGTSIAFNLENSAGVLTPAGAIEVSLEDATNGSEDTKINISGKVGGTTTDLLTFTGGKWQFYGGLDQVNITDTFITDKQIILNVGGGAASSGGCGIAIEEGGRIGGYIKVGGANREIYEILVPKANTVNWGTNLALKSISDASNYYNAGYIGTTIYSATDGAENTGMVMECMVNGLSAPIIAGRYRSYGNPRIELGMCNTKLLKPIEVTISSPTATWTVPENLLITGFYVIVTEAFNDSGTDLLDIGITGDLERYQADLDVSSTGLKSLTLTNVPDLIGTGGTDIKITYTGQNADATQGHLYVLVEFIDWA